MPHLPPTYRTLPLAAAAWLTLLTCAHAQPSAAADSATYDRLSAMVDSEATMLAHNRADLAIIGRAQRKQPTETPTDEQRRWLLDQARCKDVACLTEAFDPHLIELLGRLGAAVEFTRDGRGGQGGSLLIVDAGQDWMEPAPRGTSQTGAAKVVDGNAAFQLNAQCRITLNRLSEQGWRVHDEGACGFGGPKVTLDGDYVKATPVKAAANACRPGPVQASAGGNARETSPPPTPCAVYL